METRSLVHHKHRNPTKIKVAKAVQYHLLQWLQRQPCQVQWSRFSKHLGVRLSIQRQKSHLQLLPNAYQKRILCWMNMKLLWMKKCRSGKRSERCGVSSSRGSLTLLVSNMHSVDFAFSTLWIESTAYLQQLLEIGGETNISISAWNKTPVSYTALSTPETFDGSRRVTFTHNKKYIVGPSAIPTTQEQRYRWDPSTRLIISSTSTVADAPYCDYFRAENRWVFSATPKDGVCLVQVGIRIHWVKSTWLKKQVRCNGLHVHLRVCVDT